VLIDEGHPREAEPYLREAIIESERSPSPDSVRIAEARALLTRVAGSR